jgi:hypothetical protein
MVAASAVLMLTLAGDGSTSQGQRQQQGREQGGQELHGGLLGVGFEPRPQAAIR